MTTDGSAEMRKLAADLGAAGPRIGARAGQVMSKALNDIQAGAQNRAPVDTGALRNSITRSSQWRGNDSFTVEIGPTVNYGAFVERGTSRMRAQPYLRPATDAVTPGYQAALLRAGGIL